MPFFKLLTLCVIVLLAWQLVEIWRIGRMLSAQTKRTYSHTLAAHRAKVAGLGCLTVLAVVLIEAQVRLSPAPYTSNPFLFGFHLIVVAILVIVFTVIVLRYTGLRNSSLHRRLAYLLYSLYGLALGTGSVMLYRLPA